ncbi:MAG: hypothetical protein GF317_14370 [Candidatus Lokiarchaeota archaeon]|nr:hypothetical protein [Candidatus Lokiarchaeota archaeon]MBD3200791.1 hypothetical protein [Candidatus Lokiarchaeota archaeon]
MNDVAKKLRLKVEVMKLLNTVSCLRIMLILLVYGKQSLAQLKEKIGRSKATITHHMKKFEDLGIIKTSRMDARGSIDAKAYEIIPDFKNLISLDMEDIKLLSAKEQKEVLTFLVIRDKWLFEILRNVFQLSSLYYEGLIEDFLKFKITNFDVFKKNYMENLPKCDLLFLDENSKKKYEDLWVKFREDMKNVLDARENNDKNPARPYFMVNSLIPLEEILQFDPETTKFIRFFKVFDKD